MAAVRCNRAGVTVRVAQHTAARNTLSKTTENVSSAHGRFRKLRAGESAKCHAAATEEAQSKSQSAAVIAQFEDALNQDQRAGASTVSSGFKLDNIYKTFKGNELLKGVTWECKKGERVGLVGVNGAGKTTQLQILMGNMDPDSGEVVKSRKNLNIANLNQEFSIDLNRTVRQELASAYEEGMAVLNRTEEIQKELEECTEDMDRMSELLDELDKLSNKAVDLDMNSVDKNIDKMMPELGFSPEDNDRKVSEYSGGWQMRMCLGKILLQDPDVLLLDEPTNHLDLDAIEWLEGYIKELEIPTVIVSHDREFLDQVCSKIVETERGVATTYKGNYTQYVQQKEEAVAKQWTMFEKWNKEAQKQKDIIRRLSAGGQSGRAASAEKTLAKLMESKVEKPFEARKRAFSFPEVEAVGEVVAKVENLTHGYNGRLLFDDQSLEINRGDRIAIIGPNGAGKSTLLRLLMGEEAAQQGRVALGDHNIVPNYYEQNQSEALDLKLSVLETLTRVADEAREDEIKALLGRMMFSRAAFEKKVGVLSGGEKARLALAKFMLTRGTLLVLDEPTNHLDIPSKEMLEQAVRSFEGAVIAVSHDRYFLRRIANRVVLVEDQALNDYNGDYDYYLTHNEKEAAKMKVKAERQKKLVQQNTKAKSRMSKAQKKRMEREKAKQGA